MPRRKKALIVEEDRDVAAELSSLLDCLGFTVTALQDPTLAAETLRTRLYDVALMNMTPPETTWPRTLRTVKDASRRTTVVVMRRSADEEEIRLALNAGAYIALERPLTRQQLASLISPQWDGLFVALRG